MEDTQSTQPVTKQYHRQSHLRFTSNLVPIYLAVYILQFLSLFCTCLYLIFICQYNSCSLCFVVFETVTINIYSTLSLTYIALKLKIQSSHVSNMRRCPKFRIYSWGKMIHPVLRSDLLNSYTEFEKMKTYWGVLVTLVVAAGLRFSLSKQWWV